MISGKYKLVTISRIDRDNNKTYFMIYAHLSLGKNKLVGDVETIEEAYKIAFSFGVPVMMGSTYENVLSRLDRVG